MKHLSDAVDNILNAGNSLADVNPGVRSVLEDAIRDYRSSQAGIEREEVDRRVAVGSQTVWSLVGRCESPIEKLIVPSLVFQPYGSNGPWAPADLHRDGVRSVAAVPIAAQVSVMDSRFDFLVAVRFPNDGLLLAVECDGRAFHDEARDFYRDRNWASVGIPTVRLSGSDITADPRMAASRVAEFVLQYMIDRGMA